LLRAELRRWLALVAGLAVLGACGEPAQADKPRPELREQVRALARPDCGSCHSGVSASAKPAALAVFDLEAEDWAASMTRPQLDAFLSRIRGKLAAADLATVRAFLDAEAARRKAR
jgi:hypothetical protein